ncbi:DUF4476 domain-containing protein [Luteibaculum oceani]|uniref:DUF4476 domain-containing protein n=1 Tax=Luteibaculum oceani TaxID=1294296 RepID=A0A5C6UWI3_9FLAO|nr:DUF4476 domain-containing protein [Luteibaculum oceani]TXC76940.1 DUF4476 domain-containing protein [Luteibaculum oceani]
MIIKRLTLTCLFAFCVLSIYAQTGAITFKSAQKQNFFLVVDTLAADTIAQPLYTLLDSSKSTFLITAYGDSVSVKGQYEITLLPNKKQEIELSIIGEQILFLPLFTSTYKRKEGIWLNQLSTLHLNELEGLYLRNKYGNTGGCMPPMSTGAFEKAREDFKEIYFSKSRLKAAKSFIEEHCLMTKQINHLFDLFDFDEPKLELATLLEGHIFDLNQLEELKPELILPSSQKQFEEIKARLRNN